MKRFPTLLAGNGMGVITGILLITSMDRLSFWGLLGWLTILFAIGGALMTQFWQDTANLESWQLFIIWFAPLVGSIGLVATILVVGSAQRLMGIAVKEERWDQGMYLGRVAFHDEID